MLNSWDETDEQFDDGGTPAWRARHARPPQRLRPKPPVIEARPHPLSKLTLTQCVFIGYFGPILLCAGLFVTLIVYCLLDDWLSGVI